MLFIIGNNELIFLFLCYKDINDTTNVKMDMEIN